MESFKNMVPQVGRTCMWEEIVRGSTDCDQLYNHSVPWRLSHTVGALNEAGDERVWKLPGEM